MEKEVMKPLSTLKIGSRYTVVRFGEMGFLYARQIELVQYKVEPYAQYPESEILIYREKGKRKIAGTRFLPNDDYLVYKGWIDVKTEMFVSESDSPTGFRCKQSLLSFDREYFNRAKASVSQAPLMGKITPCAATDTASITAKSFCSGSGQEVL
jgi:hypothetical protein